MDKKLNDKNFIAIADWMISDFDFSTRELLCYAIIYGFSQDGESVFSGSLNYLSQWLGIRRDNVLRYLNSLVEKGVVIKEKKESASKSWCEYRVVADRGAARNSDHIIISPWMIEDLGLQDKELIEYALIYGFSRTGSNSYFSGNNEYISRWLGVDKSNVKRYTSSLLKTGLIKKIEENNSIKYIAVRPNNKKKGGGHFEYTQVNSEEVDTTPGQNEYTYGQIENSPGQSEDGGMVKLSTNILDLNNLNNNLDNISNNNVVGQINKNLMSESNYSKDEIFLLNKKLEHDSATVQKYKKYPFDLGLIMNSYASDYLRYQYLYYFLSGENREYGKEEDPAIKAEKLLLSTLGSKRYKKYENKILSFKEKNFSYLFNEAYDIYAPNELDDKYIRKSPEAYFIGIVDNYLQQA